MGKVFQGIDTKLEKWIAKQKMFFVATAPRVDGGLVNCSPKGMDTFRVLDRHTVAYLDLTGSGIETVAHVEENGRIVIMMCAFEGAPRIVRFHGQGSISRRGTQDYEERLHHFPELPGRRSIVTIAVKRIADSCGYSVPLYEYRGDREALTRWAEKKGSDGISRYVAEKNTESLDGLPGF